MGGAEFEASASPAVANALDNRVTQETQAKAAEHAKVEDDCLGELKLSRDVD